MVIISWTFVIDRLGRSLFGNCGYPTSNYRADRFGSWILFITKTTILSKAFWILGDTKQRFFILYIFLSYLQYMGFLLFVCICTPWSFLTCTVNKNRNKHYIKRCNDFSLEAINFLKVKNRSVCVYFNLSYISWSSMSELITSNFPLLGLKLVSLRSDFVV